MGRYLHTFLSVVAAAVLVSPCADDSYDNSPNEPLELSHTSILVDITEQTVTIGVTAKGEGWTMTGSEPWCTVSPAAGEKGITQVTVAFASNEAEGAPSRSALLTFRSGGLEKSITVEQLNSMIVTPGQNPDYAINQEIFKELEAWYYNGEADAETAPADYNQDYDDFYFNYLSTLTLNKDFEGNVWAKDNKRFLHSYLERNPAGTASKNAPPLNYGMEFDLVEYDGRLAARILYVESGSPAAMAGLRRGDWFYKVNDTQLGNWTTDVGDFGYHYNRFIDPLVRPVAGESPRLGMLTFRAAQQTLLDEGRTVTLTPDIRPDNPMLGVQVFEVDRLPLESGEVVKTGYMMYNNFDPQYEEQLIATFKDTFKPAELDNFILDLRYNKNGSVEMAELLGNLLVGNAEGVSGKTFARYMFNDPARDRTAQFAPHDQGIGVDTVFVLTSRHTAGASELLINALRGLDQLNEVKLVVIGDVTQGLAAGMVKRTYRDPDDEWEYSAWMLAFRCFNASGQGNYTWGLVPNGGEVSEWQRGENMKWSTIWEWKEQTGSTQDPLIRHAVDIIKGRQLVPAGDVVNASKRSREGFPCIFCFPTNMVMSIEN